MLKSKKRRNSYIPAVLCLLLVLSACDTGGEDPGPENHGPKAGQGDSRALEAYMNAGRELEETDSYRIDSETTITLEGTDTLEVYMFGSTSQVRTEDADVHLEETLTAETRTGGENQISRIRSWYRDGTYYVDSDGYQYKLAMNLEEALAQSQDAEFGFEESAILNQKIDGDNLIFLLDGNLVADQLIARTGNLKTGDGQADYGEVRLDVTLSDGSMDHFTLRFTAETTQDGEPVTLQYNTKVYVRQIGGVGIDFPEDLDSYPGMY